MQMLLSSIEPIKAENASAAKEREEKKQKEKKSYPQQIPACATLPLIHDDSLPF
jgi:hypothetical protein